MMRVGLILVVASIIIQLCSAQQAFLQNQLPLKVLVTTPSELASDAAADRAQAVTLTGRQAITVSGQQVQHLQGGRTGLGRAYLKGELSCMVLDDMQLPAAAMHSGQ